MGLFFRFVLKTVLKTPGWFHVWWPLLTQDQGFPGFSHCSTSRQAGKVHSWDKWTQLTKLILIPHGGLGYMQSCGICLPSNCSAWGSPAFLKMAEHLPVDGKRWINVPDFALLVHAAFSVPVEQSLSQSKFSCYYPYDCLPISLRVVRGGLDGTELPTSIKALISSVTVTTSVTHSMPKEK